MAGSTTLDTVIRRHYTEGLKEGQTVFDLFQWKKVNVDIKDGKAGRSVFKMDDVEVPIDWSNNAAQIAASKYFRKAGVPVGGRETSMRQVAHRLAFGWMSHGLANGYFTDETAAIFYDEIAYMLLAQIAAPNSPQWFNTGLAEAYGITGNATGTHWIPDHVTGEVRPTQDAYSRPQVMACFIQSVQDSMLESGGIYDLVKSEAALFKFGSGTGSNFSNLRARNEKLSGGGRSSGLMSWLRILDASAGAIKSGGTVRRAAKMAILNMDHPDIEMFIGLKAREELKVRALAYGAERWNTEDQAFAKKIGLDLNTHFNGEAYETVNGQNANYSVRITDEFMQKVDKDEDWELKNRTDGAVAKTVKARDLWNQLNECAWRCADPGVQFDDTMQAWHTCPNSGRINATNPCSEYVFLDDTACNLASINLTKFYTPGKDYDVKSYKHAIAFWTVVLEISVAMASYPTKAIAERSWSHRPLGLGYANLGALLMRQGLAYDSRKGRTLAAALTAILTGEAYWVSALLAQQQGAFAAFDENREPMLKVIQKHDSYADLLYETDPNYLTNQAQVSWNHAYAAGREFGYRNSQISVIAPTGTISFVMDCDTTGIEPDFSLVKYKDLAGGGSMSIVNQSVAPGLRALNYTELEIESILKHIEEKNSVVGAPAMREEDYAVFDCAMGERSVSADGHLQMMAVCQPFLSGAISKTVNLPASASVEEVANINYQAWKLGIKCVALYRDGCKMSQPLNTENQEKPRKSFTVDLSALDAEAATKAIAESGRTLGAAEHRTLVPEALGAVRRKLPDNCSSKRHKFSVGEFEGYIHAGMYPDGKLGEIFVRMSKQGSTMGGLLDAFATCASMALQYGVPVETIVKKFAFQKFEPAGITGDRDIPFAQSIIDYLARWIGMEFIPGFREANSPSYRPASPEAAEMAPAGTWISGAAMAAPAAVSEPVGAEQVAHARGILNTPGNDVPCSNCNSTMQRSGTCLTCPTCGSNTGCGG